MRIKSQQDQGGAYVYTPSQVYRKVEEPETIGALLVDANAMQSAQVAIVLAEQSHSGGTFGEVAIRLGLVSRDQVDRVLAQQFGMPTATSGQSRLHDSLVLAKGKRDAQSEQIRTARAKLAHTMAAGPGQMPLAFLLCSAERQAGRSYTAANLAIAFAQAGTRTLLIDADLRQPCQHMLFGVDNRAGLSTYLAGRQQLVANQIDEIPGLGVIAAGPLPPNPRELLSRPALHDLCRGLTLPVDVIILDCPALDDVDDAVQLAAATGNAVSIICPNRTSQQQAAHVASQIASVSARMIGIILNSR